MQTSTFICKNRRKEYLPLSKNQVQLIGKNFGFLSYKILFWLKKIVGPRFQANCLSQKNEEKSEKGEKTRWSGKFKSTRQRYRQRHSIYHDRYQSLKDSRFGTFPIPF